MTTHLRARERVRVIAVDEIKTCPTCGGEPTRVEVEPVTMWGDYAVSGSLAETCSNCGRFLGESCRTCGGRILWVWSGPGQALWVCEGCGYTDVALFMPPKPYTWRCSACRKSYYSFTEPSERPVCRPCRERAEAGEG